MFSIRGPSVKFATVIRASSKNRLIEGRYMETNTFDRDTFHDFVVAHGVGEPTPDAYAVGKHLYQHGDDYATAAFEVVARGLTTEAAICP